MACQDFEGQRVAEQLTTNLLAIIGVHHLLLYFRTVISRADGCLPHTLAFILPHRLLHTKYTLRTLDWPRRRGADLPSCGTAVALLQPASCDVASGEEWTAGYQCERGWETNRLKWLLNLRRLRSIKDGYHIHKGVVDRNGIIMGIYSRFCHRHCSGMVIRLFH